MNERLAQLLKQLGALWQGLSTAKRMALVGTMLAVLVGVLWTSTAGMRQSYTYLYTDLSAEDASSIGAKLKEMKVPFRLEGDGAILVPEDRVHEVRLDLAGAGLPRGGGVGFELFDKSHLGATEFEQRINHRRALEGELSRTIGTLAAVQGARVHLVLPERSVFAARKEEASASVVVKLRGGRAMGKGEIASVVHLVASAVPGLSEDRVSVVSAEGTTLHRPRSETGGVAAAGEAQAERQQEMASQLEQQARELLERTVGAGHADVRISVDLDPSAKERTEEHFDPSKTTLRSEQKTIEQTLPPEGPTAAGVPGAKSNLEDDTGTDAVAGANLLRKTSTRNWEVDKVTEKTLLPAGRVARLTVAALVDGTWQGEGAARTFTPRDRAELDRLGDLVKVAVGYSETRGDTLKIESAPFAADTQDVVSGPPVPVWKKLPRWAYYAAGGVALAMLGMILLLVRRGAKKAAAAARRRIALQATPVPEALTGDSTTGAALPPGADQTDESRLRARTEALAFAAKDPAGAATVLREWINAPSAVASR